MKNFKFALILFLLTVIFSNPVFYAKAYCSVDSISQEQDNSCEIEETIQDIETNKEQDIKDDSENPIVPEEVEKQEENTTNEETIAEPENKKEETVIEKENPIKNETPIQPEIHQKEKINPQNYEEKFSYSGFTETEEKIIKDVLRIYNENKNCGLEKFNEKIDYMPTYQEYKNAVSFFHIYFGIQENICDIVFDVHIKGNTEAYIDIYVDNMNAFSERRDRNTAEILKVISTFDEGSEHEKVLQIANYIANQTKYTDNNYDVEDILFKGEGVCNAYALTMARFCQLLNIQCDVCIGYAPSGKHAWNRITYSDGSVEYFDITFYDSTNRNSKYLSMKEAHFPIDTINRWYY